MSNLIYAVILILLMLFFQIQNLLEHEKTQAKLDQIIKLYEPPENP